MRITSSVREHAYTAQAQRDITAVLAQSGPLADDREIFDSTALAIASWWQSPGSIGRAFAELAGTGSVDSDALADDISATYREATHADDRRALDVLGTWALAKCREARTVAQVQGSTVTLVSARKVSKTSPTFPNATAWRVTLGYGNRVMGLDFYMGSGHNGKAPTVDDVTECVYSDASMVAQADDFAEWAADLGCDSDSRSEEKIYRAQLCQTRRLRTLLGSDFDAIVYADSEV
jgi:hypothetical protein